MNLQDPVCCTQCGKAVPWMQAWPGDKCLDCFQGANREHIRQQDAETARLKEGRLAIDRALYTRNPPDLSRTRQALAEYDAFMASDPYRTSTPEPQTEAGFRLVLAEEERLAQAVGEAFGHDTADRNKFETCQKGVRPDVWLRQLLAQYP